MGKLEAELVLKHYVENRDHDWLFLVRFRESKVNDTQSAKLSATPTLALAFIDQGKIHHSFSILY